MKLEPKYLAPYLPYNLNIYSKYWAKYGIMSFLSNDTKEQVEFISDDNFPRYDKLTMIMPILHPLSDLKERFFSDNENEYFIEREDDELFFDDLCGLGIYEVTRCYSLIEKLFEFHYDLFHLIDAGLAIDINQLK